MLEHDDEVDTFRQTLSLRSASSLFKALRIMTDSVRFGDFAPDVEWNGGRVSRSRRRMRCGMLACGLMAMGSFCGKLVVAVVDACCCGKWCVGLVVYSNLREIFRGAKLKC